MTRKMIGLSALRQASGPTVALLAAASAFAVAAAPVWSQSQPPAQRRAQFEGQTTQEYNQRLEQLRQGG